MSETVFYRIGDLILRVISDLPYLIPDVNTMDFRITSQEPDYTYRFIRITSLPEFLKNAHIVNESVLGVEWVSEEGVYLRSFRWKDSYFDSALELGEKEGKIGYISSDIVADRCNNNLSDFVNYFGLESLFFRFGGLFLHSAHVNVNGRALLFSAPSGTGKSTQADLWAKYAGAEIINGDRSLLRKKDGTWHAYGCPMCGTSGIHKQGNEPIHAIVMLSQGTDNTVRRLSAGEAFQRMYPEITVPKWNRELVLRAMELLDDVMAQVPIYAFSCTKDESAVIALREAIGL